MSTDPGLQPPSGARQSLWRAAVLGLALLAALALLVPALRQQQALQAARAALLQAQRGDDSAAIGVAVARYESAVAGWPNEPALRRDLADTYTLAGRRDDAVAQLEAAWQLQPESPLTQQHLALAYEAAGRTDAADTMWRALGLRAGAMNNLAQVHQQAGDNATAEAWRERAARQR